MKEKPKTMTPNATIEQIELSLNLPTNKIDTHPIDLTQPAANTIKHWLNQPIKTSPFLLVTTTESNYEEWLSHYIMSKYSPPVNTSQYLVLRQEHFSLLPSSTASLKIILLPQSEISIIEPHLREFSCTLLYKLQNITQSNFFIDHEEEFLIKSSHLEQQLLTPVKYLAKEYSLAITEEDSLSYKIFPKIQIILKEKIFSIEEINYLYHQKKLEFDNWKVITQRYQTILQQWQKAVKELRVQEAKCREMFHNAVRDYIVTELDLLFDKFSLPIHHIEIESFLYNFKDSLKKITFNTPVSQYLSLFESISTLLHINTISTKHSAVEWVNFNSINNLWGNYDIKEHHPQIELGILQSFFHSTIVIVLDEIPQDLEKWSILKESLAKSHVPLLNKESMGTAFQLPLNNKIILAVSSFIYETLLNQDDELEKLFIHFGIWQQEVIYTSEILAGYMCWFEKKLMKHFLLLNIADNIISKLIYHFIEISENKYTISCQLEKLKPILCFFDLYHLPLTIENIKQAITWPRAQKNHIWHQTIKDIETQVINVPTSGWFVGKTISLVIIEIAKEMYGLPTLITATATAGKDGLINIEREAGLSGHVHDKGVFIAEAYIRQTLGKYNPLSLTITIAFEQTYNGIEGDSATVAEVCAIFSAIANIPLNQSIGITGSMNQYGEIQAIDGISQKIEGFFEICQRRGLTGKQGVILPKQNLQNLFLAPNILHAIKNAQFHLWPCSHINEAITLLSSLEIGLPNNKGRFSKKTFFFALEEELKRVNN